MEQYKYKNIVLFLLLLVGVSINLEAQVRNYSLMASQADWERLNFNPSYMPKEAKTIITLPLLSSTSVDLKLPFVNDKTFKVKGDRMEVYADEIVRSLGNQELSAGLDLNLLGIAWRTKQNFFSINVAVHSSAYLLMDKELTNTVANGNGTNLGETIRSKEMVLNANAWGEFNFGFSSSLLEDKIRLGTRVKFLVGLANLQSKQNELSLKTFDQGDRIELGFQDKIYLNAPIKISDNKGQLDFDEMSIERNDLNTFNPFNNYGLGLDLGLEYKFYNRLSLGFALTNLGFIKWGEENATQVSVDIKEDNPISFEGFSFRRRLINADDPMKRNFEEEDNELEEIQKQIEENSRVERGLVYKTYLPTFYNLTAEYKLTKTLKAKGLVGLIDRHIKKGLSYELALTTHWQAKSWLATSLSLSKCSYQQPALGGAIMIGKGFQWFIASNNILGFFGSNLSPNAYLGFNIRI